MSGKWAPDNEQGEHAYVVSTSSWGQVYERIVYAHNLLDAKAEYGHTRQLHTHKSVRRARAEDVAS